MILVDIHAKLLKIPPEQNIWHRYYGAKIAINYGGSSPNNKEIYQLIVCAELKLKSTFLFCPPRKHQNID